MALKVRDVKSAGAGLIFTAFGGLAMIVAAEYPVGTALRMGPGYFPLIVGGVLLCFGLVLLGYSLKEDGVVPRLGFRPFFWILAAVLTFAAAIESLGLVLATFALIIMSRLGEWDIRWREVLFLCAALTLISAGVFQYALGMPFHLWPV